MNTPPPPESTDAEDPGPSAAEAPLQFECEKIAWSRREYIRQNALRWMNRLAALGMVGLLASLLFAAMTITVPFASLQALTTSRLLFTSLLLCGGSFGSAILAGLFSTFGGRSPYALGAGKVEIQTQYLVIPGALTERIAKRDIVQGWVEDLSPIVKAKNKDAQCQVVLGLRNGHQITLHVPNQSKGDKLLRALGVSVVDRVLRVPLQSAASLVKRGELFGTIGLILLLSILPLALGESIVSAISLYFAQGMDYIVESVLHDLAAWTMTTATIAAAALFGIGRVSRLLRRREVTVGADGITIEGFGNREFVGYEQITTVQRHPQGVKLKLRKGKSILLPTLCEALAPLPTSPRYRLKLGAVRPEIQDFLTSRVSREELYKRDVARREALLSRIELARASGEEGASTNAHLEALLDQRDESVDVWKTRLQKLLESHDSKSTYRVAPFSSTDLADIVEDATALPERRIAATIALSSSPDAHVRKRVRIAIETCADDDTRAALEAAAEGELQELALQRLRKRL